MGHPREKARHAPQRSPASPGTAFGRGRALPGVRLHDLRHSFASRALALGEGLPMIGKLLGHTQVQTTARYAHLAQDTSEGLRRAHRRQHRQGP